jgi:uncharacterized protein
VQAGVTRALVSLIRVYQMGISPLFGSGVCRFHPSCSEYAVTAIAREGPLHGSWKALRRLVRCTPLQSGGLDLP